MRHIWMISAATLFVFTAASQAQAQMQRDMTLDLIGAAIGGGIAGVAGVLTRAAIEDATRQPRYRTTQPIGGSTRPSYGPSPRDGFVVPSGYSVPLAGDAGPAPLFDKLPTSPRPHSQPSAPRRSATIEAIIYGLDDADWSAGHPRSHGKKVRANRQQRAGTDGARVARAGFR